MTTTEGKARGLRERLDDALSAIPAPGDVLPWAEPLETAQRALDAAFEVAGRGIGFDAWSPAPVDVLLDLPGFAERIRPTNAAVGDFLGLHAALLDGHPAGAGALRGARGLAVLRDRLVQAAHALQRPAGPYVEQEVRRSLAGVGEQLAARGIEPAWSELLRDLPAVEDQIATLRAAHEQHLAGELARLAREQAAVDEAFAAVERTRRDELADFVAALPKSVALSYTAPSGEVRGFAPLDAAALLRRPEVSDEFVAAIEAQAAAFRSAEDLATRGDRP